MPRQSRLAHALATVTRALLLLALVAFALVPQGFMPGRDASGGMVLVLCTPDGPVEMVLDPATGQPLQKAKPAPCHWASAGAGAVLPQPALLVTAAPTGSKASPSTQTHLWRPAHDPRGIQARGPPRLI